MLLEKEIHRRRLQTGRCGTDWVTSPGSPDLGYLSFLLCPASSVLGRLSRVTYPGTPVLGHLSWVTCPASPVLSRRAWQCYQFVMDTLRLCRVTAECYCRHAQHSLASSLLESNVFRIYVGVCFFVCKDAGGFDISHATCTMSYAQFAGHRPATKQEHSVGLCRARQHISL